MNEETPDTNFDFIKIENSSELFTTDSKPLNSVQILKEV